MYVFVFALLALNVLVLTMVSALVALFVVLQYSTRRDSFVVADLLASFSVITLNWLGCTFVILFIGHVCFHLLPAGPSIMSFGGLFYWYN